MKTVSLDDKYAARSGRVYLSGAQALVRLPVMQQQRDAAAGLNTAGFISGYTGSPLGTYDMALQQAGAHLKAHNIHFSPGLNEDLAATAVWGSQQIGIFGKSPYDGVFALWYGKGPGVDRSGDAIKHGNYAGSATQGGVLLLAGDDPGAKSSTIAHQSDVFFMHAGMPYLNPADVQEYLDYGLYGFALSRYSGCWVGFKCVTDTVESSASVDIVPERVSIVQPEDFLPPPQGLNFRCGVMPLESESRLYLQRLEAAKAFVRANRLDQIRLDSPSRRIGIVTTGKAYLDLREALEGLGLDEAALRAMGVVIYKVAMPWPLEPQGILALAGTVEEILVVEEKRGLIESQIAGLICNIGHHPRLVGKKDEHGASLVSEIGELNAAVLAPVLAARLMPFAGEFADRLGERTNPPAAAGAAALLTRMPSFCAGCPHNTSTRVPEGSVAMGGIGCHGLAVMMPERHTLAMSHMGGEGAMWMGIAPFTETKHIFQNMGDGTYTHSGLLAVRAVAASGVNITYKILVNDAIAMTGGQPIEGKAAVDYITRQLVSVGVKKVVVVADNPDRYKGHTAFPAGVEIFHRDRLDEVQRTLRETEGCTAIVYDQLCATEKRRRRKRGRVEAAARRIFINESVCEGCGDCGVQSNCIAIEPRETEFGRKRQINQSVCNDDYSCLKGYCPSFVSLYGARPRRMDAHAGSAEMAIRETIRTLPEPEPLPLDVPFNILVTGIGGSGVVTLGALLGMAAHIEDKYCSVLDVTGLAQRNGAVTSHIRLAAKPDVIHSSRIGVGMADAVIACDAVVAASADALARMRNGRTRLVVNSYIAPTSGFASNPDLSLAAQPVLDILTNTAGRMGVHEIDATGIAIKGFGNALAGNLFLLGYAFQFGLVPLSTASIDQAIALNGVSVEMNREAFAWGRAFALEPALVESLFTRKPEAGVMALPELIETRRQGLIAYQDRHYAARYMALVDKVRGLEPRLGSERLTQSVARNFYKLMAYKDEYEVARLHSDPRFHQKIRESFEGDIRITYHLAPPIFGRDKNTGRVRKREFGSWMKPVFTLLARGKVLRGTPFDPFGFSAHRRLERGLVRRYEEMVERLIPLIGEDNLGAAVAIADFPEHVRGYDTIKEESLHKALAAAEAGLAALGAKAGA